MTAPSPRRPALRWYGSKWQLAPWIIQHLPTHSAYVEPYGGAASVLLRKPPAKIETWNDCHGRLVNLFRVLRDQPEELIRRIDLTPYAREEYEQAKEQHPDPIEDARRFFVRCWLGRVGAGSGEHRPSGWRYETQDNRAGGPVSDEFANTDHLYAIAARFKHVQIERDLALKVIDRYDGPGVLHYVDPPYVLSTRERGRYSHELADDDHQELAERLHQIQGMVVLSGYPSPLYDELYGDWPHVDCRGYTDGDRSVTERLWLNPAATLAAPQGSLW